MSIKDRGNRYGGLSIVTHWLIAILVMGMLAFGLTIEDLPKSDTADDLIAIHKSIGILVLLLAVWRILWRVFNGFPEEIAAMRPWQQVAARAMHYALILGVLAMPLSGYVGSAAAGYPVDFFGMFSLPTLPKSKLLASIAGETHEILGMLLIVLIALHALAALKHHFIDRDGTLKRMLGRTW